MNKRINIQDIPIRLFLSHIISHMEHGPYNRAVYILGTNIIKNLIVLDIAPFHLFEIIISRTQALRKISLLLIYWKFRQTCSSWCEKTSYQKFILSIYLYNRLSSSIFVIEVTAIHDCRRKFSTMGKFGIS